MATLDANEMFYTAFEPKQSNRFVLYVDGIPSMMIKAISGLGFTQDEVVLNHINVLRKVKGKTKWNDVSLKLFDPITPSGLQAIMEWQRLHHESVTGRDGYSDFYKKDVVVNVLGPVGDIVSELVLKGSQIKSSNFGDYNWDTDSAAIELDLTLAVDFVIVNF